MNPMKKPIIPPPQKIFFNLILEHSTIPDRDEAAKGLSSLFGFDRDHADYILDCAPILLIAKLQKGDIKALTPRLTELSKLGLTFRVTTRIAEKIPRILWPSQPSFTQPAHGMVSGLGFVWENARFLCPSCGEAFILKRIGNIPLKEMTAKKIRPAIVPPSEIAPLEKEAKPPRPVEESSASDTKFDDAAIEKEATAKPAEGSNIAALKSQLELLEKEEISRDPATFQDEPFPLKLPDQQAEAPMAEMDEQVIEEVKELEPLIEEPEIMEPAPIAVDDPVVEGNVTASGSLALPDPPKSPAPATPPADDGERYNVYLSKISSRSLKEKAVPILIETGGYSQREALEQIDRPMIIAARGLSQSEADKVLDRFRAIKVVGRLAKKR